jgi:hypothetical protein
MTSHRLKLLVGCLVSLLTFVVLPACASGDSSSLTAPDFPSIERAAQRVDPHSGYLTSLPKRRAECEATAQQYYSTTTTTGLVVGDQVVFHCLSAMLVQSEKLYYDAESFGPGGITALIDRLNKSVYELYDGIYNLRPECRPWCGSMYYPLPFGEVNRTLEDAIKAIASMQFGENTSGRETWQREWEAASQAQ